MHVLVTGYSGFIGTHLMRKIKEAGHVPLPYENVKSILNHPIDAVVHLAASAGVRPELQYAADQYISNVLQTVMLLEHCVKFKVPKFVYISSSSVYGNNENVPFSEKDPTDRPLCHYAATKKAGELACYTYHNLYGLDVVCLRPFTVYGPGQTTEMAIPLFVKNICHKNKITIFGTGNEVRDYVYVEDVADFIVKVLSVEHGYEIYNVGTGVSVSTNSLLEMLIRKLGKTTRMEYVPCPTGEAHGTCASMRKALNKLGYCPKVDLDTGLDKYIEWYLTTIGGKK